MGDNKLVIKTEPKTIYFDLSKNADNNLKYQIDFAMKYNGLSAEHTRLFNYCPNISMETIFMNTENSKVNEPHKFVLDSSQIFDLKNLNKHFGLPNLSIYYTWKNISQYHKNNKLKMIVPKWNDDF